jgi:hypothetical protein
MKLVKNWREALSWNSVQMAVAGILGTLVAIIDPSLLLEAWALVPMELQQEFVNYRKYIAMAIFVAAIIARLRDQPKKGKRNEEISD